jgi:MFS family permease
LNPSETNRISSHKDAPMNAAPASSREQPAQDRERLLSGPLPATFRWLWGGQAISLTGSQLSLLSFQLIAANLLHATAMDMGILTAVQTAPYIFCGLFVGVLVDRCSRFRILVGADLVLFGILLATSILTAAGRLNIDLLWAIVGATSTVNLAYDAGLGAYMTEVVPRRMWLKANSRLSITTSGSAVAGPGIAGYILEFASASVAMSIDAFTYLVSAICLIVGRRGSSAPSEVNDLSEARSLTSSREGGVSGAMKEGIVVVFTDPILRIFAIATAIWNLACGAIMSVIVLYAARTQELTPGWVGFVMAAGGIGGVLGGATGNLWADRWSRGRVLVAAPFVSVCGAAMLLGASIPFAVPILAIGLFLINAGQSAFGVNMQTCRQEVTPRELLGRMDTTMRVSITAMASIGALTGGFIATHAGIWTTLALGASGLFFVAFGLAGSSLESRVNQDRAV